MIEVSRQGDVAVLELAHGKANALDTELCARIVATLRELERGEDRALVITARGSIFCAGVDLLRLLEGGEEYARRFVPELSTFLRTVFLFPRPVVAAINGHAIAGGCILACAADVRLMADGGGRVGIPELRVGVPFPAAALEVMRTTLEPARFRTLIYGGTTLEPAEARKWGLVDEVVPAETLRDDAVARAAELARIPTATFALTKRQMRQGAIDRIDAMDARYAAEVTRVWTAEPTLATVRAHVEKTLSRSAPRPAD